MSEEVKTHITCGHCKGVGVCKNVTYISYDKKESVKSCVSCLVKDGWYSNSSHVVKCSICNGTGWIKLE